MRPPCWGVSAGCSPVLWNTQELSSTVQVGVTAMTDWETCSCQEKIPKAVFGTRILGLATRRCFDKIFTRSAFARFSLAARERATMRGNGLAWLNGSTSSTRRETTSRPR